MGAFFGQSNPVTSCALLLVMSRDGLLHRRLAMPFRPDDRCPAMHLLKATDQGCNRFIGLKKMELLQISCGERIFLSRPFRHSVKPYLPSAGRVLPPREPARFLGGSIRPPERQSIQKPRSTTTACPKNC